MYSGTKLVDALAKQHEKRSNSGLFKSDEFVLDWRSKVGSFPHPDGETIVSAGEPCGAWNPRGSRPEDKRKLDENLKSFKQLPLNGYVPAASIRGIVRAWASKHLVLRDEIDRLLGCQKNSKFIAGKIEFLDAFPTKPTKLTLDIVNPQQNFQVFHTGSASPFSLYTLGNGTEKIEIKVAIRACRGASVEDVNTVWAWVQQALTTHGIGSRTASGYGSLQAPAGYTPSSLLVDRYSRKLDFVLYSQGCSGIDNKIPELRPTHWRGWLRSWVLRFCLGVMTQTDAEATVNELFGTLGKQGSVRLRSTIYQPASASNPKFYKWTGSIELSSSADVLDEIILPILKIAVRLGGVGRGWRRPLHQFILKYNNQPTSRGCHLELTRSPTEVFTNSTIGKANLGGNDLSLIYDFWKQAVSQKWRDRYREQLPSINAEVFSPSTCAVYLVPGTAQNPIDPKTLTWTTKETTDTRGKGMDLIYQPRYKRKEEVGGKTSSCSWVSIKRVNGSQAQPQCQEMVCVFMGNENSLRANFLTDLANIPGAVHLFGRQPI